MPTDKTKKEKQITKKKQLEIALRRQKVVDLLLSGASYRQISAHLAATGVKGSSVGQVFADVTAELAEINSNLSLSVENWRSIELQRLDAIQLAIWSRTLKYGKESDVNSNLRIMQMRDKYLSISRSEQKQIDAAETLAKLLGVSKEQIPNSDSKGDE